MAQTSFPTNETVFHDVFKIPLLARYPCPHPHSNQRCLRTLATSGQLDDDVFQAFLRSHTMVHQTAFDIPYSPNVKPSSIFYAVSNYGIYWKRVDLSYHDSLPIQSISYLSHHVPYLETLLLDGCFTLFTTRSQPSPSLTPVTVTYRLPSVPNVHLIDQVAEDDVEIPPLVMNPTEFAFEDVLPFSNLTTLSLANLCTHGRLVRCTLIHTLVTYCPSLQKLDLSSSFNSQHQIYNVLKAIPNPERLRILILHDLPINKSTLSYIWKKCRLLNTLDISYSKFFQDKSFVQEIGLTLNALPNLVRFNVSGNFIEDSANFHKRVRSFKNEHAPFDLITLFMRPTPYDFHLYEQCRTHKDLAQGRRCFARTVLKHSDMYRYKYINDVFRDPYAKHTAISISYDNTHTGGFYDSQEMLDVGNDNFDIPDDILRLTTSDLTDMLDVEQLLDTDDMTDLMDAAREHHETETELAIIRTTSPQENHLHCSGQDENDTYTHPHLALTPQQISTFLNLFASPRGTCIMQYRSSTVPFDQPHFLSEILDLLHKNPDIPVYTVSLWYAFAFLFNIYILYEHAVLQLDKNDRQKQRHLQKERLHHKYSFFQNMNDGKDGLVAAESYSRAIRLLQRAKYQDHDASALQHISNAMHRIFAYAETLRRQCRVYSASLSNFKDHLNFILPVAVHIIQQNTHTFQPMTKALIAWIFLICYGTIRVVTIADVPWEPVSKLIEQYPTIAHNIVKNTSFMHNLRIWLRGDNILLEELYDVQPGGIALRLETSLLLRVVANIHPVKYHNLITFIHQPQFRFKCRLYDLIIKSDPQNQPPGTCYLLCRVYIDTIILSLQTFYVDDMSIDQDTTNWRNTTLRKILTYSCYTLTSENKVGIQQFKDMCSKLKKTFFTFLNGVPTFHNDLARDIFAKYHTFLQPFKDLIVNMSTSQSSADDQQTIDKFKRSIKQMMPTAITPNI